MPVTNNWMIRGIDRLKGSLRMFFGWAISRCLSTTPHPMGGQWGSIFIVH